MGKLHGENRTVGVALLYASNASMRLATNAAEAALCSALCPGVVSVQLCVGYRPQPMRSTSKYLHVDTIATTHVWYVHVSHMGKTGGKQTGTGTSDTYFWYSHRLKGNSVLFVVYVSIGMITSISVALEQASRFQKLRIHGHGLRFHVCGGF